MALRARTVLFARAAGPLHKSHRCRPGGPDAGRLVLQDEGRGGGVVVVRQGAPIAKAEGLQAFGGAD
eukprot:15453492-Alexandrium_andersonii.AAC.1